MYQHGMYQHGMYQHGMYQHGTFAPLIKTPRLCICVKVFFTFSCIITYYPLEVYLKLQIYLIV